MNHSDIARSFGFEVDALTSIYPYAPVYKLRNPQGEWILKRTRPGGGAEAVACWTRSLAAQGIGVVTAADGFGDNPRRFTKDESWVVYPFIRGVAYTGSLEQIEAAGELLGRIHAAKDQADIKLKTQETVMALEPDDVAESTNAVTRELEQHFPHAAPEGLDRLAHRRERYFRETAPALRDLRLPLCNASWDYKAVNLVYQGNDSAVLVDPDSAGRIPRLFDLATAAWLFHNDSGEASPRIFTKAEWRLFLAGYLRHVTPTETELAHWQDVLLAAWMDEALWLLGDDAEGWRQPRQSGYLLSLLMAEPAPFGLEQDV